MSMKVRSTQTILFYTLSFIGCSLWAFVVDIATTALVNSNKITVIAFQTAHLAYGSFLLQMLLTFNKILIFSLKISEN